MVCSLGGDAATGVVFVGVVVVACVDVFVVVVCVTGARRGGKGRRRCCWPVLLKSSRAWFRDYSFDASGVHQLAR